MGVIPTQEGQVTNPQPSCCDSPELLDRIQIMVATGDTRAVETLLWITAPMIFVFGMFFGGQGPPGATCYQPELKPSSDKELFPHNMIQNEQIKLQQVSITVF